MDRNTKNASILMLLMAATVLLVIGCSTENSPLGPAASPAEHQIAAQTPAYQYPPLTDELLSKAPAGFRVLSTTETATDGWCDSISTSRLCRDDWTQIVPLGTLVSVRVSRGDLSSDTTIRIVAPRGCVAAADFYPHPYHFNGTVEITWNIHSLNLPRDYDYSRIVPWYVTEAGEYVALQYTWIGYHDYLVVYTNHFSRYILGGPAE
ncbi:MAG TPA: hypothetical protein VGL38_06570 [bacterium]|jgi:hypothetical protein